MIKFKQHISKLETEKIIGITVIAVLTILGVSILAASHAATTSISVEVEHGNLSGLATSQLDSTTSSGHYIKFGDPFNVYSGKLLGVNANTSDIPSLTELHATSERSEFSLDTTGTVFKSIVNDGSTTVNWLNKMTTAHIQPIPLMDTYTPIVPGSNVYIDPTIWATAVVNWCQVYCAGGSFYTNNPDANSFYAPRALEMLNEPYGGWYRGGAVPPIGYANMLIATRAALDKAGYSKIAILAATANAHSSNSWTLAVAAAGGYAASQGLAIHPYSSGNIVMPPNVTPDDGWNTIYYYHQLFNMDVYVTEVGWCTTSVIDNSPCDGRVQTEVNKDADITNAINQLGSVPWIKNFDYFNMHPFNECVTKVNGVCTLSKINSYALYDSSGNKTPAYSAYEAAAKANGF